MARTPSWDPFTTLARLDQDVDALVRRTWGSSRSGAANGRPASGPTAGYVPAIEMRSDGADVVITLELPGVDISTDVDISQITTYVNGSQEFRVRWIVHAMGGTVHFKAIAAADFFFEGSDRGTGIYTQGPPQFIGGTNADTGASGGFVEVPSSSPGSRHPSCCRARS